MSLKHENHEAQAERRDDTPAAIEDLREEQSSSLTGLSEAEARSRIGQYGYNELMEKQVNPLLIFFSYFWGPIPWMIEIAVILSALVHHWADFFIILALLVINAVVGFWEEFQAGNTIAALKSRLALQARVKRDGAWKTIPARELVPGDVIRLRIGEIVPADAKLAQGDPIEVDQSALTGESLPVDRAAGEICYSGSIVKRGEIEAYVDATGTKTFFGKTIQLVQEAHSVSHLQQAVLKIGDYLIVIVAVIIAVILVVALFRGEDFLTILQFSLILTIAAIPVAMPTVLSVTMAVGARLLSLKQVVVTKLSSIEELAGVDVLCSDKTGTLTQNRLTLSDPFLMEGVDREGILLAAALASREEDQDQIDLTIIKGLKDPGLLNNFEIQHFMPFDPVMKRTEAAVKDMTGHIFKVSKGAPQVILSLVGKEVAKVKVDEAIARFASRGFRSLGVAKTDTEGHWRLLGIIPLYDPLREDSKETVRTAREMGIHVKMLTGDQVVIAREIAGQLEIGTEIMDASLFGDTRHHETSQVIDAIEKASGFAQVFPEHKYFIVDTLQKHRHIVGMTGDGVNDAPALKKADVGIAVSGSTDAARAAADIVLLASGFSVIIDAIKESRRIFQRMTNYAMYRIAETIRVLLFMTLSIVVFNFYPVTAIMIVLLAILNDGAILSIAYDRAPFSKKPETWNMPIVLGIATILGITGVAASFGLFYLCETMFHLSRDMIQSLMYLKLSVAGQLTILITRTKGPFWSYRPSATMLWAIAGAQLIATFITVYGIFMTPIGWKWAGFVWAYAFIWFLFNDQVKLLAYRLFQKEHSGILRKRN